MVQPMRACLKWQNFTGCTINWGPKGPVGPKEKEKRRKEKRRKERNEETPKELQKSYETTLGV